MVAVVLLVAVVVVPPRGDRSRGFLGPNDLALPMAPTGGLGARERGVVVLLDRLNDLDLGDNPDVGEVVTGQRSEGFASGEELGSCSGPGKGKAVDKNDGFFSDRAEGIVEAEEASIEKLSNCTAPPRVVCPSK